MRLISLYHTAMGSIRVLSDQLVNQIAAGEVVERPASVVKELVENAIDSKATQITVEIWKGGIEKIVITDDGIGMDEMDARLAFERHATSKIATTEDLFKIRTLGFRGEALASIASVSRVTLLTKTATSLGGIRLEMEGGKTPTVSAAGSSTGTKLEVRDLFFNTPARKKYLKSDQTEYRHVLETLQDVALAHPEVTFKLMSNGRTAFDLLKTEKLSARIGALLGKSVSDEMSEVFYGGRDLQITGHVGKPHTARATRKYQYFIINGRPVQDHRLGYAVKEAYSNLIPSSQYPIFVLSLTLDPSAIDVNVHPRKLEVRFADPHEIFRVVKSSVAAALAREHLTQNIPLRPNNLDTPAFLRKESIKPLERKGLTIEESGGEYDPTVSMGMSFSAPTMSTGGADYEARKAYLLQKRAERMAAQGDGVGVVPTPGVGLVSSLFGPIATPTSAVRSPVFEPTRVPLWEPSPEARAHRGLRPLTQIKNSYIVAEDDDGIVIIDQHAAHERVMLGKLRASEADREAVKQSLLTPLHLNLTYREKAVLEEHLDLLKSVGFDLSEFGGNTYALEAVPDFLAHDNLDEVMRGFIDDLLNEQTPREAARRHEHILHRLACRAAAKFGRRLSSLEQETLVRSLLETDGSSACAHGRPTMIRLSFNELEQKFGRH